MADQEEVESDYNLRPAEYSDAEKVSRSAEVRLAMAELEVQYEAATDAEDRSDQFALADMESRFGIRHLLVISILVAFTVRATQRFGPEAGAGLGVVSFLMLLLYFIYDWQQQKRKRLSAIKKSIAEEKARIVRGNGLSS